MKREHVEKTKTSTTRERDDAEIQEVEVDLPASRDDLLDEIDEVLEDLEEILAQNSTLVKCACGKPPDDCPRARLESLFMADPT